jgi:hypothetical protein
MKSMNWSSLDFFSLWVFPLGVAAAGTGRPYRLMGLSPFPAAQPRAFRAACWDSNASKRMGYPSKRVGDARKRMGYATRRLGYAG